MNKYEDEMPIIPPVVDTTGFHPSQIGTDGNLLPLWPGASHFKEWYYAPMMFNDQPADLYFWDQRTMTPGYIGHTDLLIGIQTSEVDGDYCSPFIEAESALHPLYRDKHRNDVMAAYLIACDTLGIRPTIALRKP